MALTSSRDGRSTVKAPAERPTTGGADEKDTRRDRDRLVCRQSDDREGKEQQLALVDDAVAGFGAEADDPAERLAHRVFANPAAVAGRVLLSLEAPTKNGRVS
jgi:hypothetical protein